MKLKFRILALTAVTVLTLTFAGQGFAAVTPFTDLANVTAKDKILTLQERGFVHGVLNNKFLPNATLTAAQGIQLIVNTLDLNLDLIRFIKAPKATDSFDKANDDAWYANALITASVHGLGLPRDLDPHQSWTREEFTHQLISAMDMHGGLPMIKLVPVEVSDQDKLTVGYDGSLQRALAYGIVKLDATGKFQPKAEITRAEAAEQIFNALEYINAHPVPTPDPNQAPVE